MEQRSHFVDHFQVFDCISHVHVTKVQRTKLYDKSSICVYLGISEEFKGYKLFNPFTKRVVVIKDVIFEDDR